MDMTAGSKSRTASFVFVMLGLGLLAVGLGFMLVITLGGARDIADPVTQRLLLRLAWLSLLLLSLTLILLLWSVIRHVRYRIHWDAPVRPSEYVNAWELAGQRFQLPDDDDEDEDERADEDDDGYTTDRGE
jgi:hypothetical protein